MAASACCACRARSTIWPTCSARSSATIPRRKLALPEGCIGRYIRDLHTKASLSRAAAIDQGLLLDTFEAELKNGHLFGWFVADLLLSLGLLGTVIGFIVMLGPISGLDAGDQSASRARSPR